MRRNRPDLPPGGDAPWEERYTASGKRRARLYVEGSREFSGMVLDLVAKFHIGPGLAVNFKTEGQKLMSAVERFGRVRSVFDFQKNALKSNFLASLAADPAALDAAYDAFAEMVFARFAPMFGVDGEAATPSQAKAATSPLPDATAPPARGTSEDAPPPPGR